ncbi:MAG: glutaryl-7-ACA acylase, partial [Gemmatimonadaceae bacterium]
MTPLARSLSRAYLTAAFLAPVLLAAPVTRAAAQSTLPSETPAKFKPATSSFDYVRREVMIPMRDGVKLHT